MQVIGELMQQQAEEELNATALQQLLLIDCQAI